MAITQGTMLYAAELTWKGQKGMEGEYQAAVNLMGRATGHSGGGERTYPGEGLLGPPTGTTSIQTASEWRLRDIVWTDGSQKDSGGVGAAVVWQTPGGWAGRRYRLGSNKEVFDAGTYAIYQALRTLGQRQESGHRYTVSVDSTAAIELTPLALASASLWPSWRPAPKPQKETTRSPPARSRSYRQ